MIFLLMLSFAILNRARGSDFFGLIPSSLMTRIIATGLMALIASLYFVLNDHLNPLIHLALWVGLMIWATPGWGKYVGATLTGKDSQNDVEIRWIDWLGYKIFPYNGRKSRNRIRGAFCMNIRGGVFAIPMFIALGLFISPDAYWASAGMFLQGLIFYIAGMFRNAALTGWRNAELATGAWLGFLIALAGGAAW